MLQIIFCLVTLTQLHASKSTHEFYIAVLEIRHEGIDELGTLDIKVFSDDLQAALQNHEQLPATPNIQSLCNADIVNVEDYILSTTSIQLDGQKVDLELSSCQEVGDTYQMQFRFYSDHDWSSISVSASFLMELYPTQTQMVYVHHRGQKSTMRLTSRNMTKVMDFLN